MVSLHYAVGNGILYTPSATAPHCYPATLPWRAVCWSRTGKLRPDRTLSQCQGIECYCRGHPLFSIAFKGTIPKKTIGKRFSAVYSQWREVTLPSPRWTPKSRPSRLKVVKKAVQVLHLKDRPLGFWPFLMVVGLWKASCLSSSLIRIESRPA